MREAAEVLAVHVGSDDDAAHEERPFARPRGRAGDGAAGGDDGGEENPSHDSRLARVRVGGNGWSWLWEEQVKVRGFRKWEGRACVM